MHNSKTDAEILKGIKLSLIKDHDQINSMEDVAFNKGVVKTIELVKFYLTGKMNDAQIKRLYDLIDKHKDSL